jgi:hypothetical protein
MNPQSLTMAAVAAHLDPDLVIFPGKRNPNRGEVLPWAVSEVPESVKGALCGAERPQLAPVSE